MIQSNRFTDVWLIAYILILVYVFQNVLSHRKGNNQDDKILHPPGQQRNLYGFRLKNARLDYLIISFHFNTLSI